MGSNILNSKAILALFMILAVNLMSIKASPLRIGQNQSQFPSPVRTWKSAPYLTYYVDAIGGDDRNNGLSPKQAWKTFDRVNSGIFVTGDQILLKSGASWAGFLSPGGSGSALSPITVDKYGSAGRPKIDANGQYLATLFIHNGEYWNIGNLDVANRSDQPVPHLSGITVSIDDFGTAHSIRLHDLYIHDVDGSDVKAAGGGSGIDLVSAGSVKVSRYDGVTVENCRLKRTDRNGITMSCYYPRTSWPLSTNVVIRGNSLEDIGGDGIVPIGCDGCLIEHNMLRGGRMRAQDYAAGIWPWSCDNTVVQYNEVCGMKGTNDGEGFDSDYNCRNTLFQYNYSHDNDGGFMLICDDGSQRMPWNIGNSGTIIRNNISVDDGDHTFVITGPSDHTRVYDNIVYQRKNLNNPIVTSGNWGGYWPTDIVFRNNIFYVEGQSDFQLGQMANVNFDNNAYWGSFSTLPPDSHPIFAQNTLQSAEEPGH